MARIEVTNKFVVITGAGSGIGQECARSFARRGARLALLDYNARSLESIAKELIAAGVGVKTYPCDVIDELAVTEVARLIEADMGTPAIVINNAGIGYLGRFQETEASVWKRIFDVNVMGVVHCTRAFLPGMIQAGGPRAIVNVASTAGFSPTMAMSAYAASKHAVVGLSEVLAMELADTEINVLIVAPGIINTNIVKNPANVASSISEAQLAKLQAYYVEKGCLPNVVAEGIVGAVESGRHLLAIGPSAKLATTLMRFSRRLTRRVVISLSKKIGFE